MNYFAHPQALVESNQIGDGTRIWAFSHILTNAAIGKNCNICDHTFIENDVVIGNDVTIKCGVYIWDGVRISNNVFIGPNVTFTNDIVPRSKKYPDQFETTIIEEGASIGANSTIIAGNKIGKYAMVGAGSVVTKDIPNNSLWYGNPSKFKAFICDCGNKLNCNYQCKKCNNEFKLVDGKIQKLS
ncbi:acyltransferase [Neobacillus drentensis]|uniref:acyltransferase n=1 Tax=Neobacillus drentensis TaxID=220684 RepID=UPI002FFE2057